MAAVGHPSELGFLRRTAVNEELVTADAVDSEKSAAFHQ